MAEPQHFVKERQAFQTAQPVRPRVAAENIGFHSQSDGILISDDVDVDIL